MRNHHGGGSCAPIYPCLASYQGAGNSQKFFVSLLVPSSPRDDVCNGGFKLNVILGQFGFVFLARLSFYCKEGLNPAGFAQRGCVTGSDPAPRELEANRL